MAPLRRRWAEVKAEAEAKAEKRDLIAGSKPSPQKSRQLAKIEAELFGLLRGFRAELAAVRVLDPGVRQRQLPLHRAAPTAEPGAGGHQPGREPGRQPRAGPWSRRSSSTASRSTSTPTSWPRPPSGSATSSGSARTASASRPSRSCKPLDTIQQMDAILDLTGFEDDVRQENAKTCQVREPEWPAADVIIGNPPFLGGNRIRQELGDEYVDALFRLYAGPRASLRRPGVLLVREGAGADRGGEGEAGRAAGDARRFAAAQIARCWSGSRRRATSSGHAVDRPGFWTARLCTSRWSALTTVGTQAQYTGRQAVSIRSTRI